MAPFYETSELSELPVPSEHNRYIVDERVDYDFDDDRLADYLED